MEWWIRNRYWQLNNLESYFWFDRRSVTAKIEYCVTSILQTCLYVKSILHEIVTVQNRFYANILVCETHIRYFTFIRIYTILDHVESNIQTHFLFPKSQLHPKTLIITNHHAIHWPFPILPTAMPTTAHIRYYMILDHVESNIHISLWHQEPHQPQCQPLFISDFTKCNANHCPYSILHDFGPFRIKYTFFFVTPRASPTTMPSSAHFWFYQLQSQPLTIILHDFWPCRIEYTFFVMTPRASPTTMPSSAHIWFYQLQCQPLPIFDVYLRLAAEPTPPLHS